jgi:hypothetical protein
MSHSCTRNGEAVSRNTVGQGGLPGLRDAMLAAEASPNMAMHLIDPHAPKPSSQLTSLHDEIKSLRTPHHYQTVAFRAVQLPTLRLHFCLPNWHTCMTT